MSYEWEQVDRLRHLLDTADVKRREDILAPVLADIQVYRDGGRRAHYGSMITREAIRLTDRMAYLSEHPHLPSFMGGSALRISGDRNGQLSTPPMFTTETECLGPNNVAQSTVFRVSRSFSSHTRYGKYLGIHAEYQETETGVVDQENKYIVAFDLDCPDKPADIWGKATEEIRARAVRGILHSRFPGHMPPPGQTDQLWKWYGYYRPMAELPRQEMEALESDLKPGGAWDYPDKLYLDILTSVMAANLELGTPARLHRQYAA